MFRKKPKENLCYTCMKIATCNYFMNLQRVNKIEMQLDGSYRIVNKCKHYEKKT